MALAHALNPIKTGWQLSAENCGADNVFHRDDRSDP